MHVFKSAQLSTKHVSPLIVYAHADNGQSIAMAIRALIVDSILFIMLLYYHFSNYMPQRYEKKFIIGLTIFENRITKIKLLVDLAFPFAWCHACDGFESAEEGCIVGKS